MPSRTSAPADRSDLPSPPPMLLGRGSAAASDAAERRLREAEERLREAIEELQRHHAGQGDDGGARPSCDHADESCVAHALGNLCQSFLLSYGVRVGIGILLRAFKLLRRRSYSSLLDLKQLVSEKDLIVREEACRVGLLFGGFTGSYHALRCLLRKLQKKETSYNAILAGSLAGLSILALDDSSRRRTLALYLLARLAQCAYNSAKSKNKFHLWGSHWGHGDSLLFSLACAQAFVASAYIILICSQISKSRFMVLGDVYGAISCGSVGGLIMAVPIGYLVPSSDLGIIRVMYAFVMRPESLPKAYQDFIQKTGPVAKPVYEAVRHNCRGAPVDILSLSSYLSSKKGSSSIQLMEHPPIIPCSVIHPHTNSCLAQNFNALSATFRKTFPLYFSLTFVPFVVLHLQKFLESPAWTCWRALHGAVRSTTFLSAFVGIFQAAICVHRKVATKDHKLLYWFSGAMAGLSVLLEKKARRGELALYVLPRAADSLWYILVNRHLLPDIKNAEVPLFCVCMGGIMYYLEHEPDTMAPFLRGLIRRFLASRISNPSPSLNMSASYSYLHTLGSVEKPKPEESKDNQSTASAEYTLDSFSGL